MDEAAETSTHIEEVLVTMLESTLEAVVDAGGIAEGLVTVACAECALAVVGGGAGMKLGEDPDAARLARRQLASVT